MKYLNSPGRMEYLTGKKKEGCVFCKHSVREEHLILYEGERCAVMMNKYPYNTGHILVIPYRHISQLEELTGEEWLEMYRFTDCAVRALKEVMGAEGFNVGMNVGKAAGAGVESHLHLHIVPRWTGDTNFATVVGDVRVIPQNVTETRALLLPCLKKYLEV